MEGRGSPHDNFLLDLKVQPGSAVVEAQGLAHQPAWRSEGERVVTTQRDMQAMCPALLQPLSFGGRSFVLHELMPTSDRLDFRKWRDDVDGFRQAIRTMGEIVAWAHLRASGRRGAASADELMDFGRRKSWIKPLIRAADHCAAQTKEQWREFAEATGS